MIQHCCSHTHQSTILYLASVQGNGMAYGNVVSEDTGSLAIQSVQTGIVLNVGSVTYLYKVHVTSHHGIEPHRAIIAHLHISGYHRSFREVAVLAKSGGWHAF
jgi:hypothetical protein